MQAAEQAVQVLESAGDAGHMAVALQRRLGHADCFDDGGLEGFQAAFRHPSFGQVVKALLRRLDLVVCADVEIGLERVIDDVLAERNQLPP